MDKHCLLRRLKERNECAAVKFKAMPVMPDILQRLERGLHTHFASVLRELEDECELEDATPTVRFYLQGEEEELDDDEAQAIVLRRASPELVLEYWIPFGATTGPTQAARRAELDGDWNLIDGHEEIGKIHVHGHHVVLTTDKERVAMELVRGVMQSERDKEAGDCWLMERKGCAITWTFARMGESQALALVEPHKICRWERAPLYTRA